MRFHSLAVISLLLCLLMAAVFPHENGRAKIGFALTVSLDALAWTHVHYEGRLRLIEEYHGRVDAPYQLIPVTATDACDQECIVTLTSFAARYNPDVIVCAGAGFAAVLSTMAEIFPNIKWEISSANQMPNVPCNSLPFYGDIGSARYLAGYLAGLGTQNGRIGYIMEEFASFTIRQFNPFFLGVKKANPNARIYVKGIGAENYPMADRQAVEQLLAQVDVDTISYHSFWVESAAQACSMGINKIFGYGTDARQYIGNTVWTSAEWNFYPAYKYMTDMVLNGTWEYQRYFGSLQDGTVLLSAFSPNVPSDAATAVLELKSGIMNGTFNPYCSSYLEQYGADENGCLSRVETEAIPVLLGDSVWMGFTNRTVAVSHDLLPECWNPPAGYDPTPYTIPSPSELCSY